MNDLIISCKISGVPDIEFDVRWTPTITDGYTEGSMVYNTEEKSKTYTAMVSKLNMLKLTNETGDTQYFTCSISISSTEHGIFDTMSITFHPPGKKQTGELGDADKFY